MGRSYNISVLHQFKIFGAKVPEQFANFQSPTEKQEFLAISEIDQCLVLVVWECYPVFSCTTNELNMESKPLTGCSNIQSKLPLIL